MSLERRSRIAGPRAIFRVRPHSLACDLLAQSGIRGRGPNRPLKTYGDGCHPKGVALHGRNKIYGDGCHPKGMALHGQNTKKDATPKGWRYTGETKPTATDATLKGWRYTGKAKPGPSRSRLGRGRKYSSLRRWRRRSRRGLWRSGLRRVM